MIGCSYTRWALIRFQTPRKGRVRQSAGRRGRSSPRRDFIYRHALEVRNLDV